MALPGFKSRFSNLFGTGFAYVSYFMALVYAAVRLLPANHPYTNAQNIGQYGIRHVIAEAANNLQISKRNADQIIVFICMLFGVVLLGLQILLLIFGIIAQPAMAMMPTTFPGFFLTANEEQDIAHIFLDMVFGIPGIFNSCVQTATTCTDILNNNIVRAAGAPGTSWGYEPGAFPFPIHDGLHVMFQTFNIGLTVVAVFISIYFLATIAIETAQTGTPMGKRFNKVWAPVRFVVAFGLLFPLPQGINSAQYITLYAAKFGSGFATNGWIIFNSTLNGAASPSVGNATGLENLLASDVNDGSENIVTPNIPEIGTLLQFMYMAKTCQYAYQRMGDDWNVNPPLPYIPVEPYFVAEPFVAAVQINNGSTYTDLMNFVASTNGGNRVIIRFGRQDQARFGNKLGFVEPTCGEIIMNLAQTQPVAGACASPPCAEPGLETMQDAYFDLIRVLWFTTLISGPNYPQNAVDKHAKFSQNQNQYNDTLPLATNPWRRNLQDTYTTTLQTALNTAQTQMETSLRWATNAALLNKGWAGAGVWYNRIAEMNGSLTSTVLNIPLPSRYPWVSEKIHANKRQAEQAMSFRERFNPVSENGKSYTAGIEGEEELIAQVLWYAYNSWNEGNTTSEGLTGNGIIDVVNALFGTDGLFDMRRNNDKHPLAQLTGVGRSLVEGAVRNLTYAAIGGAGGALVGVFDKLSGATLANISGFLITFAMIGLTAGFILFYVVPFLPFIYFFFAVGGWVKGIFEAMVGVPLWALAHLRIDGNGLSGQAAVAGYFLIFEVFLRPILIIFGLIASIAIFSALVSVLHQVFDLVVANAGGFDVEAELTGIGASKLQVMRGAIDEFFYTVIYTIIVYLLGLSSFKLVDLIPNNILRWMGQSVASFGDKNEDMGQKLVGSATIGTQQALGSIGGGLKSLANLGGK